MILGLLTIFYKGEIVLHMETGGKKLVKTQKTKFRKNKDRENLNFIKQKHHDKSFYRLVKQEKEDYVI